jgi:peptidoglycan L-alanyl-D-glutamate endopeptidase CwlK
MNTFSEASMKRLKTCEPELQELFHHVLNIHDCSILEGHRDEETQNEYYRQGKSKLMYPDSKHNRYPSRGVDVAPYINGGIPWDDSKQFYYFAGIVLGVANGLGLNIRWGGDWSQDNDLNDQTFFDLPHFELVD